MPAFMSPQFVIGTIRIGSVQNTSSVNLGNNWQTAFESHQKLTQGFGSVSGDRNLLTDIRALLNDSDFIDTLHQTGAELPEWLRSIMTERANIK